MTSDRAVTEERERFVLFLCAMPLPHVPQYPSPHPGAGAEAPAAAASAEAGDNKKPGSRRTR